MYRNRILNANGNISYLTVAADKHGFLDKKYNEIGLNESLPWREKICSQLQGSYGKSPYYKELASRVEDCLYCTEGNNLADVAIQSIKTCLELLEIDTPIILQSNVQKTLDSKKSDLVRTLCLDVGADSYLSGIGAKKYMDDSAFAQSGIRVEYQKFNHPRYPQMHSEEFVPGLSILDAFFNCGIKATRQMI